jgi:hypothetical protein
LLLGNAIGDWGHEKKALSLGITSFGLWRLTVSVLRCGAFDYIENAVNLGITSFEATGSVLRFF